MVIKSGLQNSVHLIGSLPPEEVREYMEASSIFLFTSDCQEGWGAVLNESMNSGCAVIASDAAGSSGFLVHHNENGLIYRSGNIMDLYSKVIKLVKDRNLTEDLGKAAYETMIRIWNPETAADRFLMLSKALQAGNDTPFSDGPCSIAQRKFGGKLYIS